MAPNIILCLCDQLRAHEVGCYGQQGIRTPSLDRLAAEGVRCVQAVTSNPVCMPARSSLLSGQYGRTCSGQLGNVTWPRSDGGGIMPLWPRPGRTQLRDPTLPELLRAQGYRTAAIGKWHIDVWPDAIGFDHYLIPRVQHTHSGQLYCQDGGRPRAAEGFSVDWELEQVRAHLRRAAQADEPFFLYYNISPPHMPVADAPEAYLRMYAPERIPLRPNVPPPPLADQERWFRIYCWDYQFYRDAMPYTRELPPGFDLRSLIALYWGCTTWVDDTIAGLLGTLEETGLAEDTVVVFSSDHGDQLGSHGLFNKSVFFEESIRIPMLWRWPGHLAPRTVDHQVCSLLDVAPTLLAMAGVEPPAHLQGQDLSAVLAGTRAAAARAHAIIEIGGAAGGAAVRGPDRIDVLPWQDGSARGFAPEGYAYDLRADPFERQRLPACAPASEDLLRSWMADTPWMAGAS